MATGKHPRHMGRNPSTYPVHQYTPAGRLVATYAGPIEAAAATGVHKNTIRAAFDCLPTYPCRGYVWRRGEQPFNEPLWQYRLRTQDP